MQVAIMRNDPAWQLKNWYVRWLPLRNLEETDLLVSRKKSVCERYELQTSEMNG
jgi:hypothetical protein